MSGSVDQCSLCGSMTPGQLRSRCRRNAHSSPKKYCRRACQTRIPAATASTPESARAGALPEPRGGSEAAVGNGLRHPGDDLVEHLIEGGGALEAEHVL